MAGVVKCLVVDDLDDNRLVLSKLLQQDGVEIIEARSGAEALEQLLQHEFALALLDVQMPEMDGFELAELMRGSERTRQIPIIFVTAGGRDQQRTFRGYDAGGVDFLYKPVEPHVLRNKAEVFFQLHRQREQLREELQQRTDTLRLHEMFTAVLGHDLRSPLSVIANSAQMLEVAAADDRTRQVAARMMRSVRRMTGLIDDLLDLARARLAGGIPLRRATVDLVHVVQRVAQEQEVGAPGARIEVRPAGDTVGEWDAERMAQVLANLLGNALKHGEQGAPVLVSVDGAVADRVTLSVSNRGTVPPDVLTRVFDPFSSSDAGGRSEGLGLGLYIVQQIVAAHAGTVQAVSSDGTTTFCVTIPRAASGVVRL